MVKNHIKRVAAPKTWNILRKTTKFVTKQNPGAHSKNFSISLNNLLKDMLKLTKTTKETKYVLTKQEVFVNGVRRKDNKAQAGFLDTITFPSMEKAYRITTDKKGMLKAKEITIAQASELILKVTGKTKIKSGKIQINTLNGFNIILSETEAKKYKLGDTIIFNIKDHKVKEHHAINKGANAMIVTGKHSGKYGEIVSIENGIIKIKTDKDTFETNKAYALIINKEKRTELD
jgi:small subunit ribosomal protein S4e